MQLLCGGRVFIYVYTTNLLNNEVKHNAGNVLFMFVFRTALRGRGLLLDHQLTYHHFPDSGYKPAMQLQEFFRIPLGHHMMHKRSIHHDAAAAAPGWYIYNSLYFMKPPLLPLVCLHGTVSSKSFLYLGPIHTYSVQPI